MFPPPTPGAIRLSLDYGKAALHHEELWRDLGVGGGGKAHTDTGLVPEQATSWCQGQLLDLEVSSSKSLLKTHLGGVVRRKGKEFSVWLLA